MSEEYGEKDWAIWERIFAAMPRAWFEAAPSDAMEQCRSFFETNPCEQLLDLGGGFGRWALFLAGHGPVEIVGVDYAENGIRAASAWARRAGANAQFLVVTEHSKPASEERFKPGHSGGEG